MMSKPTHSSPRRHLRTAGLILWPGFVAAAVASAIFFTLIDPLALARISWPALAGSRVSGYSLGFFMFWAVASLASAITWLMQRPTPPAPARMDDEQWD
jgi:hypothetical protein